MKKKKVSEVNKNTKIITTAAMIAAVSTACSQAQAADYNIPSGDVDEFTRVITNSDSSISNDANLILEGDITANSSLTVVPDTAQITGGGNTYAGSSSLTGFTTTDTKSLTVNSLNMTGFGTAFNIEDTSTVALEGINTIEGSVTGSGSLTVDGTQTTVSGNIETSTDVAGGKLTVDKGNVTGDVAVENGATLEVANKDGSNKATLSGEVDIKSGSTVNVTGGEISSDATVKLNDDINISSGKVTINSGDTLTEGDIKLEAGSTGTLDIAGVSTNANVNVKAEAGNVELTSTDASNKATVTEGDNIGANAKVTVTNGANITGGTLVLDSATGDTITGTGEITQSGGSLTIDGLNTTTNTNLSSNGGNLTLTNVNLVNSSDTVQKNTNLTISSGTTTLSGGGELYLDGLTGTSDTLSGGSISVTNGTLTLDNVTARTTNVTSNSATANVTLKGDANASVLTSGDNIGANTAVTVSGKGVEVQTGAKLALSNVSGGNDVLTEGNVGINGGEGDFTNLTTSSSTSSVTAESGTVTLNNTTLGNSSDDIQQGANTTISGDVTLTNGANLYLDNGSATGDTLASGTITADGGSLTLDGVSTNANVNVVATNASDVALKDATLANNSATAGKSDNIGANATVSIEGTGVSVTGGKLALNSSGTGVDTIADTATVSVSSNGTLDLTNFSTQDIADTNKKGNVSATGGNVILNNTNLNNKSDDIKSAATVSIEGTGVTLAKGNLELDGSDTIASTASVNVSGGTLKLGGVDTDGQGNINATSGKVELTSGSSNAFNNASDLISGDVEVAFKGGDLTVNKGKFTIQGDDTTSSSASATTLTVGANGTVELNSQTSGKVNILASAGNVELTSTDASNKATVTEGDNIGANAKVTVTNGANITGGNLVLDSATGDTITGTGEITQSGGSLTIDGLNTTTNTNLSSNGGNLTLTNVNLVNSSDTVQKNTNLTISSGTTTLSGGGELYLDGLTGTSDTLSGGSISVTNGTLTLDNVTARTTAVSASGASTTVNLKGANSASTLISGDTIASNSTVAISEKGVEIKGGSLALNAGDTISSGASVKMTDTTYAATSTLDLTGFETESSGGSVQASTGSVTLNNTTFNNANDSIASGATVTVSGNVGLNNGALTLDTGDTLTSGDVTLGNNGSLTLDAISTGDVNVATGTNAATINLNNGASLSSGDNIGANAALTVTNGGNITGGTVVLNGNDSISSGTLTVSGGDVTLGGFSTTSTTSTTADKNLVISGGNLTVGAGTTTLNNAYDDVQSGATVTFDGGTVALNNGSMTINTGDDTTGGGAIQVGANGTLTVDAISTGDVNVATGTNAATINLNNGASLSAGDNIGANAKVTVTNGANVTGGTVVLGSNDSIESGKLTLNGGSTTLNGFSTSATKGYVSAEDGSTVTFGGSKTTFNNANDSIGADANVTFNANIDLNDGAITINEGDTRTGGTITVGNSGELTISGVSTGNTTVKAETAGGKVILNGVNDGGTIKKATLSGNDSVTANATVEITGEGAQLSGGSLELNTGDTIVSGASLDVTGGELTLTGYETTASGGYINATGGTVDLADGTTVTLGNSNDNLGAGANINFAGANLVVNDGTVTMNAGDTRTSGTLTVGSNGILTVDGTGDTTGTGSVAVTATTAGGQVNLQNNASIGTNDNIGSNAKVTITNGATVKSGATLALGDLDTASDDSLSGTLTQTGGSLTINKISTTSAKRINSTGGELAFENDTILNGGDVIGANTEVTLSGTTTINNANVTLNGGSASDVLGDKIVLDGTSAQAVLNLNGVENGTTTVIDAQNGTLNSVNSTLTIGTNGQIADNVTSSLQGGSLEVTGAGSVVLNSGDKWEGVDTTLSGGSLEINGVSQGTYSGAKSTLTASSGNLTLNNTAIEIGAGKEINGDVVTSITGGSLTVSGTGEVTLNGDGDVLDGTNLVLSGGTLNLSGIDEETKRGNSTLTATSGNLNLDNAQTFTITKDDTLNNAVAVSIDGGSNLVIDNENGASTKAITFDGSAGNDTLTNGTLTVASGNVTVQNLTTTDDTKLSATGGTLAVSNVSLNNSSDLIAKDTVTTVKAGGLTVNAGNVTLNDGDTWTGEVTLGYMDGATPTGSGTLNYNDLTSNGKLTAISGNLNISGTDEGIAAGKKTILTVNSGSTIADEVVVTIDKGANLNIADDEANINLDTTDNLNDGSISLSAGKLTVTGPLSTENVSLNATGGELTLNSVALDNQNDNIEFAVEATINGDVTITKGNVELDSDDNLTGGVITLAQEDGYTATLGVKGIETGTGAGDIQLDLQEGTLNIVADDSGDGLTLNNTSDVINKNIITNVDGNLTINNGKVYINEGDSWNSGTITVGDTGALQFENADVGANSILKMNDSGSLVELLDSNVSIQQAENISDGTLSIVNDSSLIIGTGSYNLANLNTSGAIGSIDGTYQTHTAENLTILNSDYTTLDGNVITGDGSADFKVDLYARARNVQQNGDTFTGANLDLSDPTGEGTLSISDWTLNGNLRRWDAPVDRKYEFKIFDYENINPNIRLETSNKEAFTPIGYYRLFGGENGNYTLELTRYNPQVYRAQIATLAQYNNQMTINDIMTSHIQLQGANKLAYSNANKYAAATPTLGPYQYTQEEGGLWMKGYADLERLEMRHHLDVDNLSYGTLIGADLPIVNLKHGWKFIPTPYIGYSGAHQSFKGVSSYQNGGQLGFMGTFMRNNFISSHTVYGGGYYNEMNVDGVTDKTGNWFWGTAHKAAYNWHIKEHFIIQPAALIAYSMFGKQSYHSDFGQMGMESGMLNGINIAPGMNFIYMKDTWSLYAGIQYLWNINGQVSGRAGNVNIPNMDARRGYVQYGFGGTKNIKDDLQAYGQVMFRNGGRNGVAFQLGLQYYFDIRDIKDKIVYLFHHPKKEKTVKEDENVKNVSNVEVKNVKAKKVKETKQPKVKKIK